MTKAEAMFTGDRFTVRDPEVLSRVDRGRSVGRLVLVLQEHVVATDFSGLKGSAAVLHAINSEARILIVVPSQASILRGAYMLAVKGGYEESLTGYVERIGPGKYRYDQLRTTFREHSGPSG